MKTKVLFPGGSGVNELIFLLGTSSNSNSVEKRSQRSCIKNPFISRIDHGICEHENLEQTNSKECTRYIALDSRATGQFVTTEIHQ